MVETPLRSLRLSSFQSASNARVFAGGRADEMSKNEGERAFESFTIPKWSPGVREDKMVADRRDRWSHSGKFKRP